MIKITKTNLKVAYSTQKVLKVAQELTQRDDSILSPRKLAGRGRNNLKVANKDYTDLAIRNFIKGLLSIPPKYNLVNDFKSYSEIIDFIKEGVPHKRKIRISKSSLSNLKNRRMVIKAVPRTNETERFIEYVKTRYKNFDDKTFFALYSKIGINYNNNNNKTEKLVTALPSTLVVRDEFKDKDIVKDKDTINTNNNYTYTIKRFFIDAIIFLTPSLIVIILLGCYEGSESSYNTNNLNNVVASQENVYQDEDSELISNINKVAASLQNKNKNLNHNLNTDTFTSSNINHPVSSDSRIGNIKIYSSIVLTIALIVLVFTVFPQDGAEILQKGLSEGPYSPDTLRNTEDILSEIARRKSI